MTQHSEHDCAGSPGGAYHAFAERYQRLLAEEGVEVVLVETQGSIDNLRLLDDSEVDVGLVQGGLSTVSDEEELRSIGGLFPEPFWVFVRNDVPVDTLGDLHDARMAVGGTGSGTRMLALELEADYGGEWDETSRLPLSGNAAADALLSGSLDAAAF